ncbi:MAG: helix-turn-helix domain-containing protein [Leptolyngbyaceae cyanobacterium RU_5_1]|nr:helix-turn-helix domain-containing protein [Leptolyngbyaceae cyanobacterium RU_5_1]
MKVTDSSQVEQLRQIAEYLHYLRQERAISLEKVARETFIPLRLLQALESVQLERLPEPVYVKGFIRRYADALGLDGLEIANAFQIESTPPAQPEPEIEPPPPAKPAPISNTPISNTPISNTPISNTPISNINDDHSGWSEEPRRSYLPWILSGTIAVVVVGAIAIVALNQRQQPSPQTVSNPRNLPQQPQTSSVAVNPLDSTTKETAPSPVPSLEPTPAIKSEVLVDSAFEQTVQVDVSLTDQSWLEVVADGKTKFEGMLAKGDQRTWKAEKNLMIRAGNAGAVVASFNQGEAKPLGKAGDVVDVTFPRKSSN